MSSIITMNTLEVTVKILGLGISSNSSNKENPISFRGL
jgi:hypothetical protein